MESHMVYIPVEFEILLMHTPYGTDVQGVFCLGDIPSDVKHHLEDFMHESLEDHLTKEDWRMEYVMKKIEFEVEVAYYVDSTGKKIPKTATCQTICPLRIVTAWVEKEAMKQVANQPQEGVV